MKLSFLSGTRADYSKIYPYIEYLVTKTPHTVYIFVTGMHMLKEFGHTYRQIKKDFNGRCQILLDKKFKSSSIEQENAHIVASYGDHLRQDKIDFCFIHGDRAEALAGAFAATLCNVPICHIEAGDVSGGIDEALRHSISKLSHKFFVSDKWAKENLIQMGEDKKDIYVMGNSSLVTAEITDQKTFKIPFPKYAIIIYHPMTTVSSSTVKKEITSLMTTLANTEQNYIVIYPNNDINHQVILDVYKRYQGNVKFCFYKSLDFSVFHELLIKADFLIGNSSCGIKEAPYYGIPVIDIGKRQTNRYTHLNLKNFYHCNDVENVPDQVKIILKNSKKYRNISYQKKFFKKLDHILTNDFFKINVQKHFISHQISRKSE